MGFDAFLHSLGGSWWQAPAAFLLLAAASFGVGTLLLGQGDDRFIRAALGAALVALAGTLPHHLLPVWAEAAGEDESAAPALRRAGRAA